MAPKNSGLNSFAEVVLLMLVFGLVLGSVISWIYKKVAHEDRPKLIPVSSSA
jgi:hypothetical protein